MRKGCGTADTNWHEEIPTGFKEKLFVHEDLEEAVLPILGDFQGQKGQTNLV